MIGICLSRLLQEINAEVFINPVIMLLLFDYPFNQMRKQLWHFVDRLNE